MSVRKNVFALFSAQPSTVKWFGTEKFQILSLFIVLSGWMMKYIMLLCSLQPAIVPFLYHSGHFANFEEFDAKSTTNKCIFIFYVVSSLVKNLFFSLRFTRHCSADTRLIINGGMWKLAPHFIQPGNFTCLTTKCQLWRTIDLFAFNDSFNLNICYI